MNVITSANKCMPAEVFRVHVQGARQFVDVRVRLKSSEHASCAEMSPVISMVPVGYGHGGGYFIAVPLDAGDDVILCCGEHVLQRWLGQVRQCELDAQSHELEGAFALPCTMKPQASVHQDMSAQEGPMVAGPTGALLRLTSAGAVVLNGARSAKQSVGMELLVKDVHEGLADVRAELAALKLAVSKMLAQGNEAATANEKAAN